MEQILNFLISSAHAETAASQPSTTASSFSFVIMFFIFFVFVYFAIWRPQNKRAKEQQNLLNSLAKGDEVTTVGGVLGRITKISDQYLVLNIANNTEIVMQKTAVSNVLPKGTLKSIE